MSDFIPPVLRLPEGIQRSALISACGRYRWRLDRSWGGAPPEYPSVVFLMLNPSTADGLEDDPTIRKCMAFAQSWKFFRLSVINLMAWRATDPQDLLKVPDPVGHLNYRTWANVLRWDSLLICAWGQVKPKLRPLESQGRRILRDVCAQAGVQSPHYLRLGRTGPCHPLYMPGSLEPQPWTLDGLYWRGPE